MKKIQYEPRTIEQIRAHYEIEKELASQLRTASPHERQHLYTELYNELFRRVPSHPQLTRKRSPQQTASVVKSQMRFLKRFIGPDTTFLEIGPGDCALSYEVAKSVKQVYAVDVSDEIAKGVQTSENFKFVLSDGTNMPVANESVDIVYSNQLMEHLHPDDALTQLQNIFSALAPGGSYICFTPNRLSGPHDISRYFDHEATGFHLKEYTNSELRDLFMKVGFSKVKMYTGARGLYLRLPGYFLPLFESVLSKLPPSVFKAISKLFVVKVLLGIAVIGVKASPE